MHTNKHKHTFTHARTQLTRCDHSLLLHSKEQQRLTLENTFTHVHLCVCVCDVRSIYVHGLCVCVCVCTCVCVSVSTYISLPPPPPLLPLSAALQDIRARGEHILIGPLHCHGHQNDNQRPAVTHPYVYVLYCTNFKSIYDLYSTNTSHKTH